MKKVNKTHNSKSKKQKHHFPLYDDSMDVVSSTECTGMLYKPPLTDEEADGYTDIYYMRQQKDDTSPTSNI